MSRMHSADERECRELGHIASSLGLFINVTRSEYFRCETVTILELKPDTSYPLVSAKFEYDTQWNQNIWIRKQLNDYQSWR